MYKAEFLNTSLKFFENKFRNLNNLDGYYGVRDGDTRKTIICKCTKYAVKVFFNNRFNRSDKPKKVFNLRFQVKPYFFNLKILFHKS